MQLFITKDKEAGDKKAFEILKIQVLKKPGSLIGVAVGNTTDGLYRLISKDILKRSRFWKKIKIFQIDENLGASPHSTLSFNFEVRKELKNLFKVLNPKNIFLMDGTKNPSKTIKEAYKFIKKNKGIDLIILGLGPAYDPHIAYNTSRLSPLNSKMRVVKLHPKTTQKINQTIKQGITLGIKDILQTKKALLIAYGKDKAKSIQFVLSSKVNMKKASSSALVLHKDLEIIIDKEAAKLIQ